MFGCIVKIILENNFQCLVIFWKCYFPTNFSHFLSHFLNFQKNFISQNPTPHNTETTKMPPPTPLPKNKIRDQRDQADRRESRSAREWLARKQIGERVIGDQADRRRSDPVQKGEGDQERERSAVRTENLASRTRRRDLATASRVGPLLTLLTLSSLSLSLSLYRSTASVSPSFSLSFSFCMFVSSSLCASMSFESDLKVK